MKRLTLRSVSLILAVVMLFVLVPTVHAYTTSNWAKAEVDAMAELELIPEDLMDADLTKSITRLDMCRIAVRSYESITGGIADLPDEHPFTDTTDPDVEKAYTVGLVEGKGEGLFCPDENLRRVDYFSFVSHFLSAVGYEADESSYGDLSGFSDAQQLPNWARSAAELCVGLGIVKGSGGKLDFTSQTTGEQAMAMFHRAYLIACPDAELSEPPVEDEPVELIPFADASKWAKDSLNKMDEQGLVPDSVKYSSMLGSITRGDMCKIAVLAYKSIAGDVQMLAASPFTDTEDPDIVLANQLGIVNGYTDGTFRPDAPITRQEFFKIAVNFLGAIGYPYDDDPGYDLSSFSDSGALSNYAKAPARLLVSIGVVKGDTAGNLYPTARIVSQEAIVIFCRVLDFMPQWQADPVSPTEARMRILRQELVDLALSYEGYRYVSGGKKPETGFDCSGFVYYIYKQFGYTLKPGCTTQWYNLPDKIIPRGELQPGDLVFFADGYGGDFDHVGIYIGNNKFIHAANSTKGVIITDLSESWYAERYAGAKRVLE